MPRQYEAMRDRFIAEGMSRDAAQAKAARIYNAAHPDAPVGHGEGHRGEGYHRDGGTGPGANRRSTRRRGRDATKVGR